MEKAEVDRWLRSYVEAWKSYDGDRIGGLFAEDIEYRYRPYDEPVLGREAVVRSWLDAEGHPGDPARDEPGTFDGYYRTVSVNGDVAVARGRSTYLSEPGGAVKKVYNNCFVMRFDSAGQCRAFTEWYKAAVIGGFGFRRQELGHFRPPAPPGGRELLALGALGGGGGLLPLRPRSQPGPVVRDRDAQR